MSNNKVLCICSKCKKNGIDNIGNYIHPTTKWRHVRKKYKLALNELNDNDELNDDNKLNDDDELNDNDELNNANRLLLRVIVDLFNNKYY